MKVGFLVSNTHIPNSLYSIIECKDVEEINSIIGIIEDSGEAIYGDFPLRIDELVGEKTVLLKLKERENELKNSLIKKADDEIMSYLMQDDSSLLMQCTNLEYTHEIIIKLIEHWSSKSLLVDWLRGENMFKVVGIQIIEQ